MLALREETELIQKKSNLKQANKNTEVCDFLWSLRYG